MKNKNTETIIKGICAFGVGYFLAQDCSPKQLWATYKKNKELRRLVKELDTYMETNLTNDDCSPEEYHQAIQERIDFIAVVKLL